MGEKTIVVLRSI